jgi:hypothetical protein
VKPSQSDADCVREIRAAVERLNKMIERAIRDRGLTVKMEVGQYDGTRIPFLREPVISRSL